ncbi:MAG: DUF4360 domain-containing protein [Bdellovibrionaceae bacterium]|nr:DUF4360 domain-containing protein [Pseudobdellovibrionaceae bacterium]
MKITTNWKLSLLSLLTLASVQVSAADLQLGTPEYGGTGCPTGSASVSLSPDSKSISILFDQYVVEAGGQKSFDRKNCNIAIPVSIPQGYSVSIFAIDYRGFAGIPAGGRAQLSVDYFLAGMGRGVRTSKTFSGPTSSDYLKSDSLDVEAVVWSACGANTILRANTTMLVQSNSRREQAMATVDSADVNAGLIYHVQWRQCQ